MTKGHFYTATEKCESKDKRREKKRSSKTHLGHYASKRERADNEARAPRDLPIPELHCLDQNPPTQPTPTSQLPPPP